MWHSRIVLSPVVIGVYVFLLGLLIGSFLNVCILRIPEGKSIVLPSSACPKCGAKIRPWDNIPVISYLLLRGKCRGCKTRISPMYPLVEFLTAILFFGCYWTFGLTVETAKWCVFSAIMIVLVFTDLRERILPDVVNFFGFGVGLMFSLFLTPEDGTARWLAHSVFPSLHATRAISLLDALFGAAAGGGLLWLVMEAYFRLRRREGMGLGDVKMMLMVGTFLGLKRTMLTIFTGSVLGSVIGVAFIMARGKKSDYELPFGTFLGMAALLVMFFGTSVVNWYSGLLMGR
ncbi:MAG: prepilin peptidase [Candidatus Acidiferrales bacterium]